VGVVRTEQMESVRYPYDLCGLISKASGVLLVALESCVLIVLVTMRFRSVQKKHHARLRGRLHVAGLRCCLVSQ
jgi:hypothetical protein